MVAGAEAEHPLGRISMKQGFTNGRGTNMKIGTILGILLTTVMLWAVAQEQTAATASVMVTESEVYGPYLTDVEGRSLYTFVNEEMATDDPERMTEGVREAAAPCTDNCLEVWPPLTGETVEAVEEAGAAASEGIDSELLYIEDVNGIMQVVYNGWPLYYFADDTEPEQSNGLGRGAAPNFWHFVSPDGRLIGGEAI